MKIPAAIISFVAFYLLHLTDLNTGDISKTKPKTILCTIYYQYLNK